METDDTPLCPIPGVGHCVAERCNYWDPERGCIGVGMCFDTAPPEEPASAWLAVDQIMLSGYEDSD